MSAPAHTAGLHRGASPPRDSMKAEVVICGAGIAGIAVAYQLVVVQGRRDIVLIDQGPPLALTSDKSTECYRNWWPGARDAMTALSNRSIDLMEDFAARTSNAIALDRRGYLFLSADPTRGDEFAANARTAATLGSGPLRHHDGDAGDYQPADAGNYLNQPTGADLFLESKVIARHFPYLNPATVAALHTRRCGALSAQQLGMLMLEQARSQGLVFRRGHIHKVNQGGGRVRGVVVAREGHDETIHCPNFINAAGPYLKPVAGLLGIDLPVICERHVKLSFSDTRAVIPRTAPLLIWADPAPLPWTPEERELLAEDPAMASLLKPFPPGVHGRPVGAGDSVILYWTYDCPAETPRYPLPADPYCAEILMRGISVMIPGMKAYFEHIPRAFVDGGYYSKTPDNRPLIGALPIAGAWVAGAYSGFGIMIAMAAGELLAAHLCGQPLPEYAGAFGLERFDSPDDNNAADSDLLDGQL